MIAVYYLYINGSPPVLCPRYFHFVTGVKFFLHTMPARGIAGKESRCRLDKFCAYVFINANVQMHALAQHNFT